MSRKIYIKVRQRKDRMKKRADREKLRMELELEMDRLKIQGSAYQSNGTMEFNHESSVKKLIKSFKIVSMKVP